MKHLFISKENSKKTPVNSRMINVILVGVFIFLIGLFVAVRTETQIDLSILFQYKTKFINGFIMTVEISVISLFLSLFIGIVNAIMLKSDILFFRYLARFYVELMRGTPFLVQILFFFYVITPAFGLENRFVVGFIILSLFSGSFVTEIIRGGIDSIPQSQITTANSLGFTKGQIYRYIIFPQVFRIILPSLAGQLSALVKDSSLLSIIAVSEFAMKSLEVNALTFKSYETFSFLALGYLLITIPISLLSKWLERKFYYES